MPDLSACPDASSLKRLLLGQVADAEGDQLEAHFARCPHCSRTVRGMTAEDTLVETLRSLANPVPRLDLEEVNTLIDRLKSQQPQPPQPQPEPTCMGTPEPAGPRDATQNPEPPARPPAEDTSEFHQFLSPPQAADEMGRLGGYRILKVLGTGGMGTVFLAQDIHLDRPIALKVMKPSVAANPAAKQRFLREAKACAALKHDHIITIYQVGEDRGCPFLAMELLAGMPLDAYLARGRKLTAAQILRIGREIARGLAAAHDKGLIHRDIKPGNVWLDKDSGRVKILDFGLARTQTEDVHLTQSGAIVGTPAYMAPEQARAEKVDGRCDLFSLGCVLYKLCTGDIPFKGETTMAVLMALAMETPKSVHVHNPSIPMPLSELIDRLLAKDAKDRPASAKDVVKAIQAIESELSAAAAPKPLPAAPVAAPVAPVANPFADMTEQSPRLVVPQKSTSAKKPSTSGKSSGLPFRARSERETASPGLRSPGRRKLLIGAAALVGVIALAAGIIIVRDKTGKEVARVPIPEGGSAEMRPGPDPASRPLPPLPAGASPFDALKHENISEVELANAGAGDPAAAPADLVGVFGDSRLRTPTFSSGAFSADGKRLVMAELYSTRVWDVATGRVILSLGSMRNPKFSPDGSRLYGAGNMMVEVATGRQVAPLTGATGNILSSSFSPDGKRLALGGDARVVFLADADTGLVAETLQGHSAAVQVVAYSPDGKVLASGSGSQGGAQAGEVIIWDTTTLKPLHTFKQEKGVLGLAFTPDSGRLVYLLGGDAGARICEVQTGREVAFLKEASGTQMGVSPDGRHLVTMATADKGNEWRSWDLTKLDGTFQRLPYNWTEPRILDGSPDGKRLGIYRGGGKSQGIETLDCATGETKPYFPGVYGEVTSVDVTPDGRRVHVAQSNGSVCHWDVQASKELADQRLDGTLATLSRDGQRLARVISNGTELVLSNPATGQEIARIAKTGTEAYRGVALNPDGSRLASYKTNRWIKLWDTTTGKEMYTLEGDYRQMAASADGRVLAAATAANTVKIWDFDTGKEHHTIPGIDPGRSIALNPDGTRLAARTPDEGIKVWDVATAAEQYSIGRIREAGGFLDVAFSPDGRYLAGGATYGQVFVWDAATGEKLREWQLPHFVYEVAFAPDGRHLLAGMRNGMVYVLRLAPPPVTATRPPVPLSPLPAGASPLDGLKLENVSEIERANAGDGDPAKVPEGLVAVLGDSRLRPWGSIAGGQFNVDGKRLVLLDGACRVWDMTEGRLLHSSPVGGGGFGLRVLSPDGAQLFTGGSVRDLATGQVLWNMRIGLGQEKYSAAAYSPDGKRLAYATQKQNVYLLDAASGALIETLKGHTTGIATSCLAFSPDGKYLASGSGPSDWKSAGEVILWDTATWKPLHTLTEETGVPCLAFLPSSQRLVYSLGSGGARLRDVQTGQEVAFFKDVDGKQLAVSADGTRLISQLLSTNPNSRVWQAWDLVKADGSFIPLPFGPVTGAVLLAGFADGYKLGAAIPSFGGQCVRYFDFSTSKETILFEGPIGRITSLNFSLDGRRIFTTNYDGDFRVWDAATGQEIVEQRKDGPLAVLSRDGRRLVRGGYQRLRALVVTDTATMQDGEPFGKIGAGGYSSLALNPDGSRLASIYNRSSTDQTIQVWDTATGKEVVSLAGHPGGARAVACTPDGTSWVTLGQGDEMKFWDAATGKEQRSLKASTSGTPGLTFSPDGGRLALFSYKGVEVWDVAAGASQFTIKRETDAPFNGVAFRPDGRHLASSALNGRVQIWDATSGEKVREWNLPGPVYQVAYTPDGRHLLTGNGNGTVYVLRLTEAAP